MNELHKCPVCNGKGIVQGGFYNSAGEFSITDTNQETCRSCGGKGYIILQSNNEPIYSYYMYDSDGNKINLLN